MFTIPKKPKIKLKPQAPDKRQIAVVVAIVIALACFSSINMGEVFKLETKPQQFVFIGFGGFFSFG